MLTNRRRLFTRSLDTLIWYAVAVGAVLIFMLPLINTIATSFKADRDINMLPPSWVFQPIPDHYNNVFYAAGYPFPKFFANSAIISLGTSLLVLLINLPAAYGIVRHGAGGPRLFAFVVGLRLLPPVVFIVPMFIVFQTLGMLDSLHGLILINTLVNTPLALLLLVGFIQDLPREVEESALIDGATNLQVLRYIVMPLVLPGAAVVLVMTFLWAWNEYLFSLVLTFNKATTVTVGAALFVTAWGVRWGDIAATITLSLIPTLIFTFLVQRYLIAGLTLGALKQ
jgi:multiple sugar transport system permease protein